MDNKELMDIINAKMALLGKNQVKYGLSFPSDNLIEGIDRIINSLKEYKEELINSEEDVVSSKYNINLEIIKIKE